jgi:3',5'-cyclic AMP phosphodiesterase CpdA
MSDFVQFGTTSGFGLATLSPAGGNQGVMAFGALAQDQTVLLKPDIGATGTIDTWTLGFDILVPAGQGTWTTFLQTDLSNMSDGELFIRRTNASEGGIGISGVYDGAFQYGAWQRVIFTAVTDAGTTTLKKYIDGTLVGTQALTGDRWKLDADDGFLLFSDNDGDVSSGFVSSVVFLPRTTLSETFVSQLGTADADGFFASSPVTGASQFDFANGTFDATFGPGDLSAPGDTDTPAGPPVSVVNRVMDAMKTPGTVLELDISDVFSGTGLVFSIEGDEDDVATAVLDGEMLTITFGQLGHADFVLTATDALGNVATDNFRVRSAGQNAYTIAVIPDTQDYTDASLTNGPPQTFLNMMQWLVDNKESHNIVFVSHVGDITQDNLDFNWVVANQALSILDGKINYSILPGNHDQALGGTAADHSSVFLDELFSPARQAASNPETFGGVYDQEPDRGINNFHTFTAPDGTDWLVLSMEFGPRDDVIRWGREVLEAHQDHRAIVLSHSVNNWASRHDPAGLPLYDEGAGYDYGMGRDPQGANDGETIWREIVGKYPNVAFTFSGHIFGDGTSANLSYNQHGQRVLEQLVNFQNGVAREITGNGDPALGGRGGNGAMRLVTIDPDNHRVTTETYFTEFDDYGDGFRVTPERSRDGLTGSYLTLEETFENWDLSTPQPLATANAGDDQVVAAGAGAATAEVALDASRTTNPGGEALTYEWLNAAGDLVAATVATFANLDVGRNFLTLKVTDEAGRVTTDEVLVIVAGDGTKLVETFNDGSLEGWSIPAPEFELAIGTPESFGVPAVPGGADSVVEVPALTQTQGLLLTPNFGAPAGTLIGDYSLVFDIYVPDGQGTWTSFIQTNVANTDDGELFIRSRGDGTGGIGIGGQYQGNFLYDTWQRVAFVFDDNGNGTSNLKKYIEGALVGEQTVTGDRFKLNVNTGALLFSDESNETSLLYANSILVTDKQFTDQEIADLGGASAGGILASPPTGGSVQFDFDADLAATFGVPTLSFGPVGSGGGSTFLLKGSVFARATAGPGQAAPEARLYEQSDRPDTVLLWDDSAALQWSDYTLEATIRSTDNDTIGVVFLWQDPGNHYRLTADSETNTRELVKLVDGVATVLASEIGGTRFNVDQQLKVAVTGDAAFAYLDGRLLFGGEVAGINPDASGTVGVWSSNQRSSQFDNITVEDTRLTAHAGDDQRALDLEGDGAETVGLSAVGSFGPDEIVAWVWSNLGGDVLAVGQTVELDLAVGFNRLVLTVTDSTGRIDTDRVDVEVVGNSRIWLAEDFDGTDIPATFTIVDEGEFGGVGESGTASDWTIADGRLTQNSDLQSRQLVWQGASNADVWKRGWSPLGDGVNALRVGTYALYTGAGSEAWDDYSIQAEVVTPDNQALGFLFHYVDDKNYYKFEVDADGEFDRNPGNGAGPLFNLLKMVDGVETILGQVPQRYTPGETFDLRLDIVDQKISAFINGDMVYAYAIEDQSHQAGTFGLYSWGSQGVAFDKVRVIGLDAVDEPVATPQVEFLQGFAGDPKGSQVAPPPASQATIAANVVTDTDFVLDGQRFTVVENIGVWNAIKSAGIGAADYMPAMGTAFLFANFVDVRLELGAALQGLDVLVVGAKRGEIEGTLFGDTITWIAHSNAVRGWSDLITIDSGRGDDVIEVRAISSSTLDNALLADNATPGNGPLWNRNYDGRVTVAEIDAGEGNDTILGFDRVQLLAEGGAGDDIGKAGTNTRDTWIVSGLQAGYAITAEGDGYRIEDIDAADGDTGSDLIEGFEFVRFGDGSLLGL